MTVSWADKGHLAAGGKSLEYACWGPKPSAAPTLVLLHEGLGCVDLWRGFPTKLADVTGCGVFAFSRAGYGQSDPADLPRPLDYMTREATEVLPQVLETIGFRHGVLIGHSDGATIAAIYAGRVPDMRVRGVVTMAPHFFTETMGLTEIAAAKRAYDNGDLRPRLGKYHADPDNAFRGWNDSWLHPDFKDWNVSKVIDDIQVPVLAIQGKDDQYGTLAQIEALEKRSPAPVDTLVLEGCRHVPFQDAPDRVLAEIAAFCRSLDGIEAAAPEAGS